MTLILATQPIQHLHTAEAFMYRKPEKVKNGIIREFWPICDISLVHYFTIFAATDTTT